MSKPNWEQAPVDATHWGPETRDYYESWYRQIGDSWLCCAAEARKEFKAGWYGLGERMTRKDLEARP